MRNDGRGRRPDRGSPRAPDGEERLQKIISGAGLCSRRQAERLMAEGRVTVNGRAVVEPGFKADPARAVILVDGRPLGPPEKFVYYMFHKPAGCLTTLDDPQGRPTIQPFLAELPARVFPVGRLDMDVEGLLILTNDGPLARRLMHPSSLVPKVYRVKVDGLPDETDLARLRDGRLNIGDRPAAVAGAELLKTAREGTAGARAWLSLTLTEGRRRQVKRMCSAIGHPVLKLKRVSYAGLELGRLRLAQVRSLTPAEVRILKQAAPQGSAD